MISKLVSLLIVTLNVMAPIIYFMSAASDDPAPTRVRRRVSPVAVMLVGCLAAALGGLWLLQGAALIHLEPIACLAACAPVTGVQPVWILAGLGLAGLGSTAMVIAWRGLRAPRPE